MARSPWRSSQGTPKATESRLELLAEHLRTHADWVQRLQFNEFRARDELLNGHDVLEPLSDLHVVQIQEKLQRFGFLHARKEAVRDALAMVCGEHPYHPVRDWLTGLTWDQIKRLDHWLVDCLDCDDTPYVRAIGRMFLISMVARVMKPGCKADYMLVLEGPQGAQKSEVCRILAGELYFGHMPPNIDRDPVRTSMALRGKWLLEVAELEAFSQASTEGLKAFITRQIEQFTPKYGRAETYEPRQCLFVGTTNQDRYLSDPTGGRRFWPVLTHNIDAIRLAGMREQLFAEAMRAFNDGERAWPDAAFEAQHIKPEQDERQEGEPWVEIIEPWLRGAAPGQTSPGVTPTRPVNVTLANVWEQCLRGSPDRYNQKDARRIARALRLLGWEPGKRTNQVQFWVEKAP